MRALALLIVVGGSAAAADWPAFRGANGSAVSPEPDLPVGFSETSGLRWKAALPGRGVSSPVVVGGKVYVTCSSGKQDDRLHVLCFDAATGARLWHRQLAATGGTNAHPKTCMAAPTPAADTSGVYALFATGDVAAFAPDGTLRWYRALAQDYPAVTNQVGMAASPVLAGGKLIVPLDNAGDSFLAALDTATGKNVWKVARPRDINWVTPVVRTVGEKAEVILPGPKEVAAYDAATGAKLWAIKAGGSIPSPTLADDTLLLPAGEVVAAKLGDAGQSRELWRSNKLRTGHSSPLLYDGRVYAANPAGLVMCVDAKTGQVLWQERVKGPFSASPVAGDGKVYVVNEAGELTTLKAGDQPEVLGTSKTGEEGLATPAISGGAVFLRGDKSLFCVGPKTGG